MVYFFIGGVAATIQFYFYDKETKCPLNGYLFVDEELIGKTQNGTFNLSYADYKYFKNKSGGNRTLVLFGKLGKCFNEKKDFYFDKSWKAPEIKDFRNEITFYFSSEIKTDNPIKRELLAFIKPESVREELEKIKKSEKLEKKDIIEDISKINNYLNEKIKYVHDWGFFLESHWQTPSETLERKKGDCEDFSILLLSLIKAYDPSLKCYNIVFTTHVTTFCYIDDYYVYYDQGKTELKRKIKNWDGNETTRKKLKELNDDYFKHYNLTKEESKAKIAYDDKEYFEFENEEDFLEWQYNLKFKGEEEKIFDKLEREYQKVMKNKTKEKIKLGEEELKSVSYVVLRASKFERNLILFFIGILILIVVVLIFKILKI